MYIPCIFKAKGISVANADQHLMVEGKVSLPKKTWREVWRQTMARAHAVHWYNLVNVKLEIVSLRIFQ